MPGIGAASETLPLSTLSQVRCVRDSSPAGRLSLRGAYLAGRCAVSISVNQRPGGDLRPLSISAANRFLLVNRPDDYVPLYKAVYEDFPSDPVAGLSHWKVTFQTYLRGKNNSGDLLREHLRNYPLHPTSGAALYFLGRFAEQENDLGLAKACYRRLADVYQNHYYAMLARDRLQRPEVRNAEVPASAVKFLAEIRSPQPKAIPTEGTRETNTRIERSRLLRTAGLDDLADAELRFGARTDGQPALLGMEIAGAADAPHRDRHPPQAV